MSETRVYVPTTWAGLRQVVAAAGLGPAPLVGHAVTDGLRAGYPDGGEEEWEYVATTAAARTAIGLQNDDDPPRRVVLAVDATGVRSAGAGDDPTLVEVGEVVAMRKVAAVLVDTPDAADDVRAARSAWADAEAGDPAAEAVVDRCLDHDLAWFAVQELGELLTWE